MAAWFFKHSLYLVTLGGAALTVEVLCCGCGCWVGGDFIVDAPVIGVLVIIGARTGSGFGSGSLLVLCVFWCGFGFGFG